MANRGSVQGRRRYLRCLTFVCVSAVADWIGGREQHLTGAKVYVHAEKVQWLRAHEGLGLLTPSQLWQLAVSETGETKRHEMERRVAQGSTENYGEAGSARRELMRPRAPGWGWITSMTNNRKGQHALRGRQGY